MPIVFQQAVTADSKYDFANPSAFTLFDIHNDTPFNMGVSFGQDTGIQNADYYTSPHSVLYGIPAPGAQKYSVGGSRFTGMIFLYTQTPIGGGSVLTTSSAPASSITVIGYPAGSQPQGTTSLNRQQTVGNNVNTVGGSATSVQNDNNPLTPSNVFVESTPTGASGSTVSIATDGTVTIKGDVANVLTTLLQLIPGAASGASSVKLADSARTTEILGKLLADGTLESVGAATLDSTLSVTGASTLTGAVTATNASNRINASTLQGGANLPGGTLGLNADGDIIDAANSHPQDVYIKVRGVTAPAMHFQCPSGSDAAVIDGSGTLYLTAVQFQNNRIRGINSGTVSVGAGGSAVVNHGLAGTPIAVLAVTDSGTNSGTCGCINYTATQFTLFNGAGATLTYRWWAYCQ